MVVVMMVLLAFEKEKGISLSLGYFFKFKGKYCQLVYDTGKGILHTKG